MHRFFVEPECIHDDRVRVCGDVAHRIGRVLRMAPGDHIVVLDNSGQAYEVLLNDFSPDCVQGRIIGREDTPDSEPDVAITLYQALLKGKKMELILQKCTEIGMAEACFFSSEYSERRRPQRLYENRVSRWRSIVREAAEQSGRRRLPSVLSPLAFEQVVTRVEGESNAPGLFAVADPSMPPLSRVLKRVAAEPPSKAALLIGPEGGFHEHEIALAQEAGLQPFWLGPRVLRAETAPLVVLGILLYVWRQME